MKQRLTVSRTLQIIVYAWMIGLLFIFLAVGPEFFKRQ